MAHLWMPDADRDWVVLPLTAAAYDLEPSPPSALPDGVTAHPAPRRTVLVRAAAGDPESWVLITGPHAELRVNGLPSPGGARALQDRDEIRIPGAGSCFFSSECAARVEAFPAPDAVPCPRCRQPIGPGTASVRCPRCLRWHHQTAELPCWTYAGTCALCPQPTPLDAGYQWTPAEL